MLLPDVRPLHLLLEAAPPPLGLQGAGVPPPLAPRPRHVHDVQVQAELLPAGGRLQPRPRPLQLLGAGAQPLVQVLRGGAVQVARARAGLRATGAALAPLRRGDGRVGGGVRGLGLVLREPPPPLARGERGRAEVLAAADLVDVLEAGGGGGGVEVEAAEARLPLVDDGAGLGRHAEVGHLLPRHQEPVEPLDGVVDDHGGHDQDDDHGEGDGKHNHEVLVNVLDSPVVNNHVLALSHVVVVSSYLVGGHWKIHR